MRIALIAACDRDNYGDILLPYITKEFMEKYFSSKVSSSLFGLSKADMSKVGGGKTESLFSLKAENFDAIIVSGGEVMSAKYYNMLMNLDKYKDIHRLLSSINYFSNSISNIVAKYCMGGKQKMPWIVGNSKKTSLFYNAVSGYQAINNIKDRHAWLECVSRSKLFSVRDRKCYEALRKDGKDVILAPDTAVLVHDLFCESDILKNNREEYRDLLKGNYYIIQTNKRYGMDLVDQLVFTIHKTYVSTGIPCVLLAIGKASGHEDQVPLSAIRDKLQENECMLITDNNIYETINIIRNSIAFFGTSLHGIVTSASFEKPHALLTKSAIKTLSYMETWNSTRLMSCTTVSDIYEIISEKKFKDSVLSSEICQMKQLAYDYLKLECEHISRGIA